MKSICQVVLPLDLGILISKEDSVFKVAEICEELDYAVENLLYNAIKDYYLCPDGRKLKFRRESTKTTENGYSISTRYYSNDKCGRCPHREKCHKSKNGYRTIMEFCFICLKRLIFALLPLISAVLRAFFLL